MAQKRVVKMGDRYVAKRPSGKVIGSTFAKTRAAAARKARGK